MWDNDSSISCWPLCILKGGNQACCSWSFKHCVWGSKVIILHLYWNSQEMPKMKGQGQGQSKEQKSKNPNSSFSKSSWGWSLARGSVRAPGRKYWKWTNSVDAQSCKCLFVQKNISALVGDAGVGRLHIEDLHQGGGDTGRNVSPAKLVVWVFFLS